MKKSTKTIGAMAVLFAVLAVSILFATGYKFNVVPTSSCTAAQRNTVDCSTYDNQVMLTCSVLSGDATGTWYYTQTCPTGQVCKTGSGCVSGAASNCPSSFCQGSTSYSSLDPNSNNNVININGVPCHYVIGNPCGSGLVCSSAGTGCVAGGGTTCTIGNWYGSPYCSSDGTKVKDQQCQNFGGSGTWLSAVKQDCSATSQVCSNGACVAQQTGCTTGSWYGTPYCDGSAVKDNQCQSNGMYVPTTKQTCTSTQTCSNGACVNNAPNLRCGDGICSPSISETCSSCSGDCGSCQPTSYCGDGQGCVGSKTYASCPSECPAPATVDCTSSAVCASRLNSCTAVCASGKCSESQTPPATLKCPDGSNQIFSGYPICNYVACSVANQTVTCPAGYNKCSDNVCRVNCGNNQPQFNINDIYGAAFWIGAIVVVIIIVALVTRRKKR